MRWRRIQPAVAMIGLLTMSGMAAAGDFQTADGQPGSTTQAVGGLVAATCGSHRLPQMTAPQLVEAGNMVYCPSDDHPPASQEIGIARAFLILEPLALTCVEFGIDSTSPGDGWPVEVRVFRGTVAQPYATLQLLGSVSVSIPGGSGPSLHIAELTAPIHFRGGDEIIVELSCASRAVAAGGDGGFIGLGGNSLPESAPTYVRSVSCDTPEFVTLASIDFPDAHVVMSLLTEPRYATPLDKPGWEIVFHDEFDDDSMLASGAWMDRYPWGRTGPHDGEPQYYSDYLKDEFSNCSQEGPNHIFANDGTLRLRAKVEPGRYETWHWDADGQFYTLCDSFDYTSGMLYSQQSYQYGYFEMRCTVPYQGEEFFPAFWLFDGNDYYREFDIFEFDYPGVPNYVLMSEHIDQALEGYAIQDPWPNDTNNSYHDKYQLPQPADVSTAFHTYAIEWTPNNAIWYVDGVGVFAVQGHSPHLSMPVIVNLAIAPWRPLPPASHFPADMVIDYIRVYRSQNKEFISQWNNTGDGTIGSWAIGIGIGERHLAGDFDGDGLDELLSLGLKHSHAFSFHVVAKMLAFDGTSWPEVWGNHGNSTIGPWQLKWSDSVVPGDYDGDGRDDLLCVTGAPVNNSAAMLHFNNGAWQSGWSRPNTIGAWTISSTDTFHPVDTDGDGRDELLCIQGGLFNQHKWAAILRFNNGVWQTQWSNGGNGRIGGWGIAWDDTFVIGDFDGDGRDDLLGITGAPANNWAAMLHFDSGAWNWGWGNQGSNKIDGWTIRRGDTFLVGDFDGAGRDQLLCITGFRSADSPSVPAGFPGTDWATVLGFDGDDWSWDWSNYGSGTIQKWKLRPSDGHVVGEFGGDGSSNLLSIDAPLGWSHLLHFEFLP